jgi:thymidylate synthase
MTLNPDVKELLDFRSDDFTLHDYQPQAHIAAPVAV